MKLRVLFKVVEAYLGPYQKSMMKIFYEKGFFLREGLLKAFNSQLFFLKALWQPFYKPL